MQSLYCATNSELAELVADYDDGIWGAGDGGRAGREATFTIVRVGALCVIDALVSLDDAPKFIIFSYLGSTLRQAPGDASSWDA